jgi:hypothetical protein
VLVRISPRSVLPSDGRIAQACTLLKPRYLARFVVSGNGYIAEQLTRSIHHRWCAAMGREARHYDAGVTRGSRRSLNSRHVFSIP